MRGFGGSGYFYEISGLRLHTIHAIDRSKVKKTHLKNMKKHLSNAYFYQHGEPRERNLEKAVDELREALHEVHLALSLIEQSRKREGESLVRWNDDQRAKELYDYLGEID